MGGPPVFYPPANHTAQWYQDDYPGTDMGGVDKLLLHSTEGSGWPAYDGGAKAPTLTYHPQSRAWRQHFYLTRSARALQDKTSTAVRENRDRVVQVEIIGTCDPVTHRAHPDWPYIPGLSDANLDDLAALFAFLNREFGTPLVAAPLWLPYPASYGATKARMSGPTYDAFRGLLGHQHASGNDHGDPGLIAAGTIVTKARAQNAPKPPTTATAPSTTAGTGGEDSEMTRLVSYGGGAFIVGGLFRRHIPWTEGQVLLKALIKAYGPVQPITAAEMGMYTPLDTVLAIQGAVAKNVGLTLTGQAAIAADLDALQDDLADDDGAPGASA